MSVLERPSFLTLVFPTHGGGPTQGLWNVHRVEVVRKRGRTTDLTVIDPTGTFVVDVSVTVGFRDSLVYLVSVSTWTSREDSW